MKNLMITILMISGTSFAQTQTTKSIAASQVTLLAKAAVYAEVESFNEAIANDGVVEGYHSRLTQFLVNSGKTNIDPEFMVSKCTLSEENIGAVLSQTLSSEDDALAFRKNGLAAVKSTYNGKVWRLLSAICDRARVRFMDRLSLATENGVALAFSDQVIVETAQILFYPTDFGRASFRKAIAQGFNSLLSGAMVIGAGSGLMGIPVGGMILAVVTVVNGTRGIVSQIHTHNPFGTKLGNEDFAHIHEIKIDLN